MKKTLSFLFAVIMIFSAVCSAASAADMSSPRAAYAEANGIESEEPSETGDSDEPEIPDTPDNPETPDEPDEEQYVARLYICSRIVFIGHAWIYVENLTDDVIMVGCYPCPAGQGVSVGTSLFTRADGAGNYYNMEAYMGNKKGLSGTKSISMLLDKSQLETVNEKILKTNEWTPFTNCCLFASKVWNSVSDRHVAYGVFPFVTLLSMLSDNEGVPDMYYPDASQCYKQKGKKDGAYLKPCSKASFVLGVG